MKITNQCLKKFQEATPETRILNGHIKRVELAAEYANGWKWVLSVERVHPLLEKFGGKNEIKLLEPTSMNSWIVHSEIDSSFQSLVDELYAMAETSDSEAVKLEKSISGALSDAYEEMGWVL